MWLLLISLTVAPPPQQCGLCHPDVRVLHQASVHSDELVVCTDCHGGDGEAIDVAKAHRGNFRGAIPRKDIPKLCASCHANSEKMRPYNLPTDQYALYETSQHGRQLARGDTRVAVCTDCHGTHDILKPENPTSRVFQRNIPETCAGCHADAELMKRYGLRTDVYQEYLNSRHAEELLRKNNRGAPECSRCHGVHGATPPGVGDIDKVCGSCHSAARAAFLSGPHGRGMVAAGLPECVSCHGSHGVKTVQRGHIAQSCAGCHEEGSAQIDVGEKMDVLFERAEEEIEKARAALAEAEAIPLYVEDHQARLQEARTFLLEAEPAVHSVQLADVERYTRGARSLGEEIQAEIQGQLADLRLRRVGLLFFWFFLLLTMAIVYRFRREATKR